MVWISEATNSNPSKCAVSSETGSTLELRLDTPGGPVKLPVIDIPKSNEWTIVNSRLSELQPGIHNLVVRLTDNTSVEIDWIRFNRNQNVARIHFDNREVQ